MTSFCWAALIACLLLTWPSGNDAQLSPLEVTGEYRSTEPGDSFWTVTLKDPGISSMTMCDEDPRVIEVPRDRLTALRKAISREHFFELNDEYGAMPLDGPVSRIDVRLGVKVKRVSIFSVKAKMSRQEADGVDRAKRVWLAIQECFRVSQRRAFS